MKIYNYIILNENEKLYCDKIEIVLSTKPFEKSFSYFRDIIHKDENNKSPILGSLLMYSDNFDTIKDINPYYVSHVYLSEKFRKMGLGLKMYKMALIAANLLNNRKKTKSKKPRKLYFCADAAVGGSTSSQAWRCYQSLHRRRYLKIAVKDKYYDERSISDRDIFEVKKIPRNIKPIIIEG